MDKPDNHIRWFLKVAVERIKLLDEGLIIWLLTNCSSSKLPLAFYQIGMNHSIKTLSVDKPQSQSTYLSLAFLAFIFTHWKGNL